MSDTERLCWAAFVADENMPEGLATPDKWIAGRCEQGWIIGPKGRRERVDYGCMIVQPGAEVLFMWHERRGTVEMIVRGDSTYTLTGHDPGDWSIVWDADEPENMADTLDEFARQCVEVHEPGVGEEVRVAARFSKWTEERYRLEVTGDKPRFVPVQPEPALASGAPEGSA
ncbi:hypothetical protein AncyloWKF20_05325 [Ancylobacter sp. WKF20]|uniref:hypothetical protein n=1 Tax=Ancylobacter sp. WKF20 TaxID=3039801 RepID=UPI00243435B1|nr:hypothetical protein [Ancylobacter sp. WKF20]WGD31246.1 hypothetical protein AncyloWKF20_05325 [Ancylobacter sp. WKF20]